MRRFLVLLIVLGLLLPVSGSAGTAGSVAGNPFTKPSFKNDTSGTVSALPVHEDANTAYFRLESRYSLLRYPPSWDILPFLFPFPGASQVIPKNDVFPCPLANGLPLECGLTVIRLARADH